MRSWRYAGIGVAIVLLAAAHAGAAEGSSRFKCKENDEKYPTFSGYHVYEENDSIVKDGGDERYTQGLRVEVSYHRNNTPCWAEKMGNFIAKLPFRATNAGLDFGLVLGQNEYTPRIITSTRVARNDRSFSDFTYFGAVFSATANDQKTRHKLEVDVGRLGSQALAKATQGGLHTLKMRRVPKGWDTTEPKTWGANAYYRMEKRWAPGCTYKAQNPDGEPVPLPTDDSAAEPTNGDPNCTFDLTFGYTGEAGSVRTSLGLHGSLRLGWRLSGFPSTTIQSGADLATRPPLEAGIVVGFEPRHVFNTEIVRGTTGSTGFSAAKNVTDFRFGFYARYDSFRFSYQKVRRSSEFSVAGRERGPQDFATISASYEPQMENKAGQDPVQSVRPWLFRHWQFELGMGTLFNGPGVNIAGTRPIGAQLVARKGLVRRGPIKLNLGLMELAAGTVQVGLIPEEPYNRKDLFLRQRAVTLGVTWSPKEGQYGQFGARVGTALWGNDAAVQTVRHEGFANGEDVKNELESSAKRGGLLLGAQYFLPVERHLAIGGDIAYHDVRIDPALKGVVTKPSFWKVLFLVQVRP